jgi:hypothetical protein
VTVEDAGWGGRRIPASGWARRIPCSIAHVSAEHSTFDRPDTTETVAPADCQRVIARYSTDGPSEHNRTDPIESDRRNRTVDS